MGEIAESMINGECCSWCNVYFQKLHGYQVACESCWEETRAYPDQSDEVIFEDTGVQKAIHKEL